MGVRKCGEPLKYMARTLGAVVGGARVAAVVVVAALIAVVARVDVVIASVGVAADIAARIYGISPAT